jgi:hypothetical protein
MTGKDAEATNIAFGNMSMQDTAVILEQLHGEGNSDPTAAEVVAAQGEPAAEDLKG